MATNAPASTIFGIYSAGDVVRPEETSLYHLFLEGFHKDLAPEGAMETTLAAEIVHAAWRLRRCAAAESSIDTQLDPRSALTQQAIDRARAQALRIFQHATAELRRIQTERHVRNETLPDNFDASTLGLAGCKDLGPVFIRDVKRQLLLHKLDRTEMLSAVAESPAAKQTQSIPRSAPCPCGSGAKYKRCCGASAPAVLSAAA